MVRFSSANVSVISFAGGEFERDRDKEFPPPTEIKLLLPDNDRAAAQFFFAERLDGGGHGHDGGNAILRESHNPNSRFLLIQSCSRCSGRMYLRPILGSYAVEFFGALIGARTEIEGHDQAPAIFMVARAAKDVLAHAAARTKFQPGAAARRTEAAPEFGVVFAGNGFKPERRGIELFHFSCVGRGDRGTAFRWR
jgi:hypothetical protein